MYRNINVYIIFIIFVTWLTVVRIIIKIQLQYYYEQYNFSSN